MKLLHLFLAGTATAAWAAEETVSPGISIEPSDAPIVLKTVVSSKLRFIFPVGLEGTGHHYIVQVEDHLFRTNENLTHISLNGIVNRDVYGISQSMGYTAQHYRDSLVIARKSMGDLAERGATLDPPGTVVAMHGRNSYPFGFGPNKALRYVDLRTIAEAAEEKNVDLRVLYMRRPVKDILIANTIHRDFQNGLRNGGTPTPEEKYMQYMQVLLTDIAVMHSFLAELGPGFVVCHDFSRVGEVNQAVAIANFLAPNEHVAELLTASFVAVAGERPNDNESLEYEGVDVVTSRLQRKFDAFESIICPGF